MPKSDLVATDLQTRAFDFACLRLRSIAQTFRPVCSILLLATGIYCLSDLAIAQQPPQRPHIFGIERVQFFSSNIAATRDFYSRLIAAKQLSGYAGCDRDAATSGVYVLGGQQAIGISLLPSPAPSNLLDEITFGTDDLLAMQHYLEFHKIPVIIEKWPDPCKPRAAQLTVTDPEGHRVSFFEWPNSESERTSEIPVTTRLIHAGFVVHDRAAEDAFYKDLLGFHLYWHGGMTDAQTDWVDMQVPDGAEWIEYMLNVPADANKHTLGVMDHVAIGVPNIHEAYQALVDRGWKPKEEPKIGRDGKWQLNLYDPDDTRIELMEFTPTDKPCCSSYVGTHPGLPQSPQSNP